MVQKEDINETINQEVLDDSYGKRIETAMNQLNEVDENTNESKYLSNDLIIKRTRCSKFRLFQEKCYRKLFDPTHQELIRQNP